mgnify:FL=1|tara:strand:+ start:427 stop:852 length:426 start_codon:yes stop_codon:yes gene_type:complete
MTKAILTYKFLIIIILFLITYFFLIKNSYAVEPEEFLKNPDQELRARNISKIIRCLVCQNQSIDESSSPFAKDIRIIIRKKIVQDFTDEEIYSFLTDRYGDFILLNPPINRTTYVLWSLPFILFTIGIIILYWHNRKSSIK